LRSAFCAPGTGATMILQRHSNITATSQQRHRV